MPTTHLNYPAARLRNYFLSTLAAIASLFAWIAVTSIQLLVEGERATTFTAVTVIVGLAVGLVEATVTGRVVYVLSHVAKTECWYDRTEAWAAVEPAPFPRWPMRAHLALCGAAVVVAVFAPAYVARALVFASLLTIWALSKHGRAGIVAVRDQIDPTLTRKQTVWRIQAHAARGRRRMQAGEAR